MMSGAASKNSKLGRTPKAGKSAFQFHPLTADRWADLEALFGPRGACAGCWCMFFRLPRAEYEQGKSGANRKAFKRLVHSGEPCGLLAYVDGAPVGWCAIAPRAVYPRLDRARVSKPIDDQPVWSVTCFFIDKSARGKGLSVALLEAAVQYAKRLGARIIEGYPVDPTDRYADTFAYVGLAATFKKAGFVEVARRTPTRPVMRRVIKKPS